HHLVVGEAIDVADLDTFNEQAVKAGEIVSSPLVSRGMRLLPITRHRSREMRRVLLPRAWPWRFKMESRRHVCASQYVRGHCNGVCKHPQRPSPITRFVCLAQIGTLDDARRTNIGPKARRVYGVAIRVIRTSAFFHGLFYGRAKFCCNTVQFYET